VAKGVVDLDGVLAFEELKLNELEVDVSVFG
jgi:hypothetical protein